MFGLRQFFQRWREKKVGLLQDKLRLVRSEIDSIYAMNRQEAEVSGQRGPIFFGDPDEIRRRNHYLLMLRAQEDEITRRLGRCAPA